MIYYVVYLVISVFLPNSAIALGETLRSIRCNRDNNEEFLPKGEAPNCDTECETLGQPCITQHIVAPSGCYCISGFARDDSRTCIPINQCSNSTSPRGEERRSLLCPQRFELYYRENEAPLCDRVCRRLDRPCKQLNGEGSNTESNADNVRPPRRRAGCFCDDGYARDENGICISILRCPTQGRRCGTNEVFLNATEAPRCDALCRRTGQSCLTRPPRAGCYCDEGYARNANMQCVKRRYCRNTCTGENEIFLPRGTAPYCDAVCASLQEPCGIQAIDAPSGCYCLNGFCRNRRNVCVPVEKS